MWKVEKKCIKLAVNWVRTRNLNIKCSFAFNTIATVPTLHVIHFIAGKFFYLIKLRGGQAHPSPNNDPPLVGKYNFSWICIIVHKILFLRKYIFIWLNMINRIFYGNFHSPGGLDKLFSLFCRKFYFLFFANQTTTYIYFLVILILSHAFEG